MMTPPRRLPLDERQGAAEPSQQEHQLIGPLPHHALPRPHLAARP